MSGYVIIATDDDESAYNIYYRSGIKTKNYINTDKKALLTIMCKDIAMCKTDLMLSLSKFIPYSPKGTYHKRSANHYGNFQDIAQIVLETVCRINLDSLGKSPNTREKRKRTEENYMIGDYALFPHKRTKQT